MKVTFLGTGTSTGVPAIGCDCETCLSTDPRDKRLRVSLLIEHEDHKILIDTSADFRQQALRVNLRELHAVLITHAHADHIFGLDDVRPLNDKMGAIPIFANEIAWTTIRQMFGYIFRPRGAASQPEIVPHTVLGPFSLCGLEIQPVEVIHGSLPVLGFRIGDLAYITDCNLIPDEACAALQGLEVLILDCLHYNPHPTHLHVAESLRYVERLAPRHTYFTHMSHRVRHAKLSTELPSNVELAYDGLSFEL